MVSAKEAVNDVDITLFVVDAARNLGSGARDEAGRSSHRDKLARLMAELTAEARMDDVLLEVMLLPPY